MKPSRKFSSLVTGNYFTKLPADYYCVHIIDYCNTNPLVCVKISADETEHKILEIGEGD